MSSHAAQHYHADHRVFEVFVSLMLCFFNNSRMEGLAIPLVYTRAFALLPTPLPACVSSFSPAAITLGVEMDPADEAEGA